MVRTVSQIIATQTAVLKVGLDMETHQARPAMQLLELEPLQPLPVITKVLSKTNTPRILTARFPLEAALLLLDMAPQPRTHIHQISPTKSILVSIVMVLVPRVVLATVQNHPMILGVQWPGFIHRISAIKLILVSIVMVPALRVILDIVQILVTIALVPVQR